MKRWAVLAVAACGGGTPAVHPGDPPTHRTTRVPVEEAEPEDDGVSVVSSHGHMEPAVVDAGIRPHHGALGECFTGQVGRRRWLGGQVSLHWDIQRDGVVTAVTVAESDLGNWPIEKCLLEVARSATFGKPVGGKAEFALPLAFGATGSVSAWDADAAGKAVGTAQLAKLDECAKQKGVKGGNPRGVVLTLYVGPQGKVQSVGFASKAVLDDAWADCAEETALAWKLPDPRGTIAKLAVSYR